MSTLQSERRSPTSEANATQHGTRSKPGCALAIVLVCLLGQVAASFASDYAIDWWSVAGGGSTSTGGVFTATGTIGQPTAASAVGGQFTVQAGFWGAIAAVQTTNAPVLSITISATNSVIIYWPAGPTTWQLQQTPELSPPSWSSVGTPPQQVGDQMQIIVSPPTGNRFFRLTR
jgi:hypothetical protein